MRPEYGRNGPRNPEQVAVQPGAISGLAAALWQAVPLTGPALFIVLQMTTAPGAVSLDARNPQTIAEARSQGAASVLAWAGQDNLGGLVFMLTYVCLISLAVGIAVAGSQQQAARRPPPHPSGQDT